MPSGSGPLRANISETVLGRIRKLIVRYRSTFLEDRLRTAKHRHSGKGTTLFHFAWFALLQNVARFCRLDELLRVLR